MMEAMACGIPVIATNYSAHMEFLDAGNGYLIDVADMVEVDDSYFYGAGEPLGVWAQPNLEHLQALMRRAFEDPRERRAKGLQARADMVRKWSWASAAHVACGLLCA
jgi:glycosyltransferase involved in cell wall biosynthesis